MSKYQCMHCGMSVKGMTCGKCDAMLMHSTVEDKDGKKIQVCECPHLCGKIKSPVCCNHDMKPV